MKSPLLILFILIFTGLSHSAFATVVDNLYSATVIVQDQSIEERQRGFQKALAQVLTKTTGIEDIGRQSSLTSTMAKAADYMDKYAYLPQERRLSQGASSPSAGIPLLVSFPKVIINNLMRKLALPIWPADRSELLVWVVEKTSTTYRFIDNGEQLPPQFRQAFDQRGLAYQLPLYDLRDKMTLSPMAAWSLNTQELGDAAKRYGHDSWLLLRYQRLTNGRIQGSWLLSNRQGAFAGKKALVHNLQTASTPTFFSLSIHQAIGDLAQTMSYLSKKQSSAFPLLVENITDYTAFSELNGFLNTLEIVNSVNVRTINKDSVLFDLRTEGKLQVLHKALRKEPRLARVTEIMSQTATDPAQAQTPLQAHFRWRATY